MGDLIRTTAELVDFCKMAREAGILSIDTEFVWRRTYRPQLGIVQLGTRNACCAVDCLTGLDTASLREIVECEDVVKILHDARQDLMHLRHWTGATPCNVFDTQMAAAFAGFPAHYGLQKLLFEAIDVGLPKTETCTDWVQRPLSDAQVRYALDDVRYLPRLREELVKRSIELGTHDWLVEELCTYDEPSSYDDCIPDEMWKRVKTGRARLDGRGRAILRAVTALREELAKKWNLPRAWLGDDFSLVRMAVDRRVGRIVHRLRGGQEDTIRGLYAQTVREAEALPESEWPNDPNRHYIPDVLGAADEAMEWLEERSKEIHVDAGVIATRAMVTAFVDDVTDETNPLACGWRFEAVGEEMSRRFGVE